jgi:phosphatidylserine/phosphatidylglycerophosphate/cardiolipin synthase-like enzyme
VQALRLGRAGVIINQGSRNERNSKVCFLQEAGIPVAFDRDNKNILHNKVMVIDDIIAQGSFNFTLNADLKNGENLNFIKEAKKISFCLLFPQNEDLTINKRSLCPGRNHPPHGRD